MTRMLASFGSHVLLLLALSPGAAGIGSWSDRFYPNGPDAAVNTLLVHEGALHAGGAFTRVGNMPAQHIARFDGSEWSALGGGVNGTVRALAEFDGDLIAAGSFQDAGGVPASNIARWDGAAWQALGDGLPSETLALIVFDDDLIAGTTKHGVMRWDGSEWKPMGDEFVRRVKCLAVYRGELFAGSLGSVPEGYGRYVFVWRWTSSGWVPLTSCEAYPVMDCGPDIIALQVLGDRLYALGNVMTLDDAGSMNLCYWDGAGWHQIPSGWTSSSYYDCEWPAAILPRDGGFLLGGLFWGPSGGTSHSMALYDGSGWSALPGSGLQTFDLYGNQGPWVYAMAEYQGDVYVAGGFAAAGTRAAACLARWDGSRWSEVATGGQAVNGIVRALAYWDGKLVAGGSLVSAGEWVVDGVAVLDGEEWAPIGAGVGGHIYALVPYEGGVAAAGYIWSVNGVRTRGIAVWDGSGWSGLGSGLGDGDADALVVWEGDLVAGGRFERAGEVAARNVARWDGAAWMQMGPGLDGRVEDLEVHEGALYAAGEFAGGVARWVDGSWQSISGDFGGEVVDLQSTPHGLYACGRGGLWLWVEEVSWWHFILTPGGRATRLGIHKGDLLAAGTFTIPGLPGTVGLIRLVGEGWLPIDGAPRSWISAIAASGLDLAVGGTFRSAGDLPAWGVALRQEIETPMAPMSFAATRSGKSVVIAWELTEGAEEARYLLYREADGPLRTLLTPTVLTGRRDYTFSDSAAPLGSVDYWIEQVSYDGSHIAWFGPAHVLSTAELWPLRDVRVSPNPTRRVVRFSFELPFEAAVRIDIFDASGRRAGALRPGSLGPGASSIEWDCSDCGLAAGVYWVRLSAGQESRTARFVLIP